MDCIMEPEVITIDDVDHVDHVEPLWIGFINCGRKNLQSVVCAYNQLKERSSNWVLGLNDVNYKQIKDSISDDNVNYFFANGRNKVAILTSRTYWQLAWSPDDLDMVTITNSSRKKGLNITCALLSRPKTTLSLKKKEEMMKSYCRMVKLHKNHHQILMGDVNSCSCTWTMDNTDSIGKLIADTVIDLCFENVLLSNYHNWTRLDAATGRKSWIDAIFVDDQLHKKVFKAAAIDLFETKQRMIIAEIDGENICELLEGSKFSEDGPIQPALAFGAPKVKFLQDALDKLFVITDSHRVPKIVFLNQVPSAEVARLGRLQQSLLQHYRTQERQNRKCVQSLRFLCIKAIVAHNKKKIAVFFKKRKLLITNEAIQ